MIVAMYIRKSTSRQRGRTYVNYMLVESVLTPDGPRQRTVCSLGNLKPRKKEEWLKLAHKVETSLAGQCDLFSKDDPEVAGIVEKVKERREREKAGGDCDDERLVSIGIDEIEAEDVREAGSEHVGFHFIKKLGLDGILKNIGMNERTVGLTCAMLLNRLIEPSSENAMPDWFRERAVADILGADFDDLAEDSLYRNMDKLYPHRARIESALASRERNLFNLNRTVFFYDLTSTYFEGQALGNPKAKRGYSRDSRPDCKQVVIGLAVNDEGFPLAHEIFEGNTLDHQTLDAMLDAMNRRIGLAQGQTVVVDRGMAFDENIKQIKARKLHYIVASRQQERDEWLSQLEDMEGFKEIIRKPSPTNPYQKKTRILVKKELSGGETLALCHSDGRTEKDRAIRLSHEKKLLADIATLAKSIASGRVKETSEIHERIGRIKERYPRVSRYWHITYDAGARRLAWHENEEKRNTAERLDGSYILKTDRPDLDAEQIWRIYTTLTRAENAFRNMKSPLRERPVFHQLEHRVETHIFLCVLAYHLLVSIEKTLLDNNIHTSWATTRKTLDTHKTLTISMPTDNGMTLKIRKDSKPGTETAKLYRILGVPPRIAIPKTNHRFTQQPQIVTEKTKITDK